MGILPKRVPQESNPPNGMQHEGQGGQSGNHSDNSHIVNRPEPTQADGNDLIQVENPLGTPGPNEIQR